ncbi:MAG TPA: hypothetical protein VEB86_02740 [Chryseosolibacter sp.]|nr:hypothetical protein [Chryseosolibacter sp.]
MKITRLLLMALAVFAFSCSDDEPEPSLESAELSLTGSAQLVVAPAALTTSSDPYAQMAAGWIESINAISQYTLMFETPAGATKSTTKITATNGRPAGTTGEYLVYTWSDQQSGYSVAYQISQTSDHFTWEIFFKTSTSADWLKYIHAEEKKDKSTGFMKVYDIWGFIDEDPSLLLAFYNWSRNGDIFTFEMESDWFEMHVVLTVNTKTKAGSVVYYIGDMKWYEMTWDAAGNGTWKSFDEQGNIDEQGTWTAG